LTASVVQVLNNNDLLLRTVASHAMPTQAFYSLPSTVSGESLNGMMLRPPGFNDGCETKYPVLMYVYGGPGSQEVHTRFPSGVGRTGWHNYLVSNLGFIVFTVDPIGTGGLGDIFQKKYTTKRLGVDESSDIIGAAEWLHTQCYVDTDRIALWGWSYGGYLSSMVAFESSVQANIKSIIAVAPVVDWTLYDTAYTERFMKLPNLNSENYKDSSVLVRATDQASFFVKNYLLVHGTSDDNVHFQNGALLAEQLVNSGLQFEIMVYTDRDHSLTNADGSQNTHLYKLLTNFLLETLDINTD